MSSRTSFLSRLLGLYCIIAALSLGVQKQATIETVTAIVHDSALMMVLGVITFTAGLAMVLGHNIWSGGATTVVVTIISWVTLIKGLLFLFLPPDVEATFFLKDLHYDQLFYLYLAISLVVGVYLTFSGFASKSHS